MNRALFWGIVFLLSRVFPSAPEDVELAVIGTAIGIGLAAASIGGSVASGVLAKKGATVQARAAERSSEAAIAEQRRQFGITQGNLAPFLGAGTLAVQRLAFLLGLSGQPTGQPGGVPQISRGFDSPELQDGGRFERLRQLGDQFGFDVPERFRGGIAAPAGAETDPEFGSLQEDFSLEDFQADPGFEFRLSEGQKALERSAAARGGLLSGGTLKELERFAQGTASQEFQSAFNRFQTERAGRFNRLASVAGLGQITGAQLGELGARTATNIGNLTVGGQTAAAAARASGFSALGQSIGGGVNTGLNFLLLSQLAQGGGAGPSASDVRDFFQ
jgi:hypothetical protein